MSSAAVEAADPSVGPLEQKHLRYANYRAVAGGAEITRTHWHIALANGLGWGFDGMDGVMFALVSPLIIEEFASTSRPIDPACRSRSWSVSPGSISGRGSPTAMGGAPCWRSTSPCSRY
jgi:hypothetical protein